MKIISVRITDEDLERRVEALIARQPVRVSDGAFAEALLRQAVEAADAAPDNPLAWMHKTDQ